MASAEDLDGDVAAAIAAQTVTMAKRMLTDYDDDSGETIPNETGAWRQRIDYIERAALGSNDFEWACQVEIDGLFKVDRLGDEKDFLPNIWLDQRTLTDPKFWRDLDSVYEVNGNTTPQIVEPIEKTGNILKWTMAVQVILKP